MADNEDGEIAGGSFSQLLFAADGLGLDSDGSYNYSSSFSPQIPPKMLCFGDNIDKYEITRTAQKSGVTSSASSSTTTNASSKVNKRNGSGKESIQTFIASIGAPANTQMNCKRKKSENPTVSGHVKVKREKLGERITSLQQLVSPYGKTDTASVLHEAMGYIRFLQEQVQVLCSPYLKSHTSSSIHLHHQEGGEITGEEDEAGKDLRSRGLCLVPVDCIAHVANNNNGADYWSPAAMGSNFSPNP